MEGENAPEAALLNSPTLPPTGGGILQHPLSVAFAIMLGTAEAEKSLVQSMRRKTKSFDSSSRMTLACILHKRRRALSKNMELLEREWRCKHLKRLDEAAVAVHDLSAHSIGTTGDESDSVAKIGQHAVAWLNTTARGMRINVTVRHASRHGTWLCRRHRWRIASRTCLATYPAQCKIRIPTLQHILSDSEVKCEKSRVGKAEPTCDVEERATHADDESASNGIGRVPTIRLNHVTAARVQRLVRAACCPAAREKKEPGKHDEGKDTAASHCESRQCSGTIDDAEKEEEQQPTVGKCF